MKGVIKGRYRAVLAGRKLEVAWRAVVGGGVFYVDINRREAKLEACPELEM
jgi:hypothetical protein